MSSLNKFSTDSSSVTRRKYVSNAKRNYTKAISSSQNQHNETFSGEILGSNAQISHLIEVPWFDVNLGDLKSSLVRNDSQDYNEIAKERTQESLNISSSIEGAEVDDKLAKFSSERDEEEAAQELSHKEGFKRNYKLSVITNLSEYKEDDYDFCNSNESTPHLYVDYADRLKNILLEYFDE